MGSSSPASDFDLGFDNSPPQSRPVAPTTPKRKRTNTAGADDNHLTPTKRSSSSYHATASDSLNMSSTEATLGSKTDNLTPMKRSGISNQQPTPTTISRDIGRFQFDVHSLLDSDGVDDPLGADEEDLPPLVRPKLTQFTSTDNDGSNRAKESGTVTHGVRYGNGDAGIFGNGTIKKATTPSATQSAKTSGSKIVGGSIRTTVSNANFFRNGTTHKLTPNTTASSNKNDHASISSNNTTQKQNSRTANSSKSATQTPPLFAATSSLEPTAQNNPTSSTLSALLETLASRPLRAPRNLYPN
jgi:hypothetical protein